jgi:purine nucleoside phosphorylase
MTPGEEAARAIRAEADLPYEVGIVLGSGLGGLADDVAEAVRVPYADLPGFPSSNVSSHHNELVAGWLEGVGVALHTGVYFWFSGPSFETPAEISMARKAGAHAVGMSTVPEVILGRFFGLRCGAVSTIVNFAAGMTGAELSHEETKALAPIGAAKLGRIVRRYLRDRGMAPRRR